MHQGTAAELCVRLQTTFVPFVCVCVCVCFTGRRRVSACIRAQLQNCVYASDHLCTLCVCVCVCVCVCCKGRRRVSACIRA